MPRGFPRTLIGGRVEGPIALEGLGMKRTATAVSYTAKGNDLIIAVTDTTAARTITIPSAFINEAGYVVCVKDESGLTSAITIATEGSETIEGLSSYVLTRPYEEVWLYSDGTNLHFMHHGAGTGTIKRQAVTAATYTISQYTDYDVLGCSYNGAIAIAISAGGIKVGRQVTIKDEGGYCSPTNTITITPASGSIDGQTTKVLRSKYASTTIYCNGTNYFSVEDGGPFVRRAVITASTQPNDKDVDIYGVKITAAATITLDDDMIVSGRRITIKDESGNAGTYNITIATEGASTIDGDNSKTIATNYGCAVLICDGTNWFSAQPGGPDVRIQNITGSATVSSNDVAIAACTITAATTITLSADITTPGKVLLVKDIGGNAGTNNITITPASGNIDGGASAIIRTNHGSLRLFCNGTNWFRDFASHRGGSTLTEASSAATFTSVDAESVLMTSTLARTMVIDSDVVAVKGRVLSIIDASGAASVGNITISCETGELINGAGNIVIAIGYGSVRLRSDGTQLFTEAQRIV